MLSFAAANADEVDIARIFAAKKSTGAAQSGRKRKAGDDESAEKRPGTVCAHKTNFQHGHWAGLVEELRGSWVYFKHFSALEQL